MTERLTEEQVAEALSEAIAGSLTSRALLQVSADLSAMRERHEAAETGRLTWMSALGKKLTAAGFTRADESLMGMAEDALKALSALQAATKEGGRE